MTEPHDSPSELRDYYDTTEFPLSGLRRVPMNRAGKAQEAFALRLPPEVIGRLRVLAEAHGVGVSQLVREWVIQRLESELRRPSDTDARVWERTRTAVEELLPEIVSRVAQAR